MPSGSLAPREPGAGSAPGTPPPTDTPPPPPPPATPRRRAGAYVAVGVIVVLIAVVVGASVIPLPYYAFRPGSVRDTESLISVGDDTQVFPAEGSIGYTTVSLRQTTLVGLLQGWLDDDVDIHPEDEVLGNRDADENRTFNLALMDDSKNTAAQVALEKLGYDVPVTSDGEQVLQVAPDSDAQGTLEPGDTIVAVDGEALDSPDDLARIMTGKPPGEQVRLGVEQPGDDAATDVDVTLTADPQDAQRGVIGVAVQPRDIHYDFPVDLEIDTGDVGGPSAGLAFTLGILDDLTPGELTGGEDIAVTGTIQPDGTVGPVGGAGQKAAAVRDAGIGTFLVPRADYEAAEARAGDVDVIPVDDVDDALAALADLGGNGLDLPDSRELAAG
jgi:PDZ domain-containing protein